MNWSKFKLKKICTIYQVTNSYFFNDKHNADSYLISIAQIFTLYELSDGVELSEYELDDDFFKATFIRINPSGVDIECVIDFDTKTLMIVIKE